MKKQKNHLKTRRVILSLFTICLLFFSFAIYIVNKDNINTKIPIYSANTIDETKEIAYTISKNSTVEENIFKPSQDIVINDNTTIKSNVTSYTGNITIGNNVIIEGSVSTSNGDITIGNNGSFNDVLAPNGKINQGENNIIIGKTVEKR